MYIMILETLTYFNLKHVSWIWENIIFKKTGGRRKAGYPKCSTARLSHEQTAPSYTIIYLHIISIY